MRSIITLGLLLLSTQVYTQTNYEIVINSPEAYQGNLFFQKGGDPPKNVMIISPEGEELFVENWGMKGWDFKVNDNNHLTYFDRSSKGWFVMDSLQQVVDSVYCLNGYEADNHDFIALPNGNYVLFAYDMQPYPMDLIVEGGNPNAMVEGLIIQELDSDHNLIFEWSSWDHFDVLENPYFEPWTQEEFNFIHTNSIDIDFDGHFIISSRNMDEITKIHRTSGEIIWRWGGAMNEFDFVNDYPFTHQHTLRCLGDNKYLLYDNGNYSTDFTGMPNYSRAVEYVLDTIAMTCTQTWEYVHPDFLFTPSIGSTQRLPNGNTLIDFGNLQLLETGSILVEVTPDNEVVFQLEYDNGGNLYRAHKFDWFFYDNTENVQVIEDRDRVLVSIFNTLGQEVEKQCNTLQFYLYSDGSVDKVFSVQN
ncbi:MAG: hypothetical protein CMB32_01475 [Euryarchaeota archaeon]|nr:hypothetical protein [Euryarchaeota archaeon]